MKYVFLFLIGFAGIGVVAQNSENSFSHPVFPECENESQQESEKCFYNALETLIIDKFRWSEIQNEFRGQITLRFKVLENGSFQQLESDVDDPELKSELYYLLFSLPSITPAKVNDEFQSVFYEMSFYLDTDGRKINAMKIHPINSEIPEVDVTIIDKAPIFPGCENQKNNEGLKNCMSRGISEHIGSKFNVGLASGLNLKGRQKILVQFTIDVTGYVADVKVKGPHPRLEEEARMVVMSLPKMIPGEHEGKLVGVLYALPIMFDIE